MYISEFISEKKAQKVFKTKKIIQILTAPTGAGKTFFVEKNVIELAKSDAGKWKDYQWNGKKALILANRSVLVKQVANSLGMTLSNEVFEDYNDKGFTLDYFDIMSYQLLARKIVSDLDFLNSYSLIVADECHYFISDAWNGTSDLVLKSIIEFSRKSESTTLFLSATTENIMESLNSFSSKFYDEQPLYKELISISKAKTLGLNSRLDIKVTDDSLENIINSIPKDEKILVFVNEQFSKECIEKLADNYSTEERSNIGFLYSIWEKKGLNFKKNLMMENIFLKVINNEGFPNNESMIITNSACDNGVNFKMENLKHIILYEQYDWVQIRQMIGRKRHNSFNINDRTNVYVKVPQKEFLKKKLNEAKRCLEWYFLYEDENRNEFLFKNYQKVHKNSVRLVNSKDDLYSEAIREREYLKNQEGIRFDSNFPFLLVYFNHNEYLFINHCLISKNHYIYRDINDCLKYLKKTSKTIADYYQQTLSKYYDNVSIGKVKRTKKNIIAIRDKYFTKYLETFENKQMSKLEYSKLRENCYREWKVENKKQRRKLGDMAFREFIQPFGFSIEDVNSTPKKYNLIKSK